MSHSRLKITARPLGWTPRAALGALATASLLTGAAATPQAPSAAETFADTFTGFEVTRHPSTGQIEALRGRTQIAGAIRSKSEAVDAARALAVRWCGALGARGFDWDLDYVGEVSGIYAVRFVPMLRGARLDGATARFVVTADGYVRQVDVHGLAEAPAEVRHDVSMRDAAALARVAPAAATGSAYAERPIAALARRDQGIVAAWRVRVFDETAAGGQWSVLIDGRTGEALQIEREALASVDGAVEGNAKAVGSPSYGAPTLRPLSSLYVYGRVVGSGLVRLTTNARVESDVAIADDASRIVWAQSSGGTTDVWASDLDGSNRIRLTANPANDRAPSISADGATVVFVSDRDGNDELYRVQSDGTGLTRLTSNDGRDAEPSLSDAGDKVAFVSDRTGNDEVWTLDLGTSVLTQITAEPARDFAPALSGNGARIAFLSDRDGDTEVLIVDASGGVPIALTFDDFEQGPPSITDDGSAVFFASRALDPRTRGVLADGASLAGSGGVTAFRRTPNWSIWGALASTGEIDRLTDKASSEVAPAISGSGALLGYVREGASGAATLVLQDLGTGLEEEITAVAPGERIALSETGNEGAYVAPVAGAGVEAHSWSAILSDADITDIAGEYSLDLPDGEMASISTQLRGQWARVKDISPATPDERNRDTVPTPSTGNDFFFNFFGVFEEWEAQTTAYASITDAHDYVAPELNSPRLMGVDSAPIDRQVRVEVNGPAQVHNAYYYLGQDRIRTFLQRSPNEPNTAIPSVLWHEYGHFVDDRFGGASRVNSNEHPLATSEGIADMIALVGNGSHVVGEEWRGEGTVVRDYLRDILKKTPGAENRHYDCTDCRSTGGRPEPHDHGEALANFALRLHDNLPVDADELLIGAIALAPGSMQQFVDGVMLIASTPGFCGSCPGMDVAHDEGLYLAICRAAASAGFNCPERADGGSLICFSGECGTRAAHHTTGVEWLGATVTGMDSGCAGGDDDGLVLLGPAIGGMPVECDVTLSVAMETLSKGRYARSNPNVTPDNIPVPSHALYLNAWLYVDDGMGNLTRTKVWGTGSGNPLPDDLPVGAPDTLAFDPNQWGGRARRSGSSSTCRTSRAPDRPSSACVWTTAKTRGCARSPGPSRA